MAFDDRQIADLSAKLDGGAVKQREQAGRKVSYIEGWHAIAEANRIFGFDAWDRETVELRCVAEKERKIGKGQYEKDGWGVGYIVKVRVTVRAGEIDVVREGTGFGSGIDADLGAAHESAIKEGETDAMKRALMTFGNPFGLALYDKGQTDVDRGTPEPRRPAPAARAAQAPAQSDPSPDWRAILASTIKQAIDAAPDLAALNALMKTKGVDDKSADPLVGSDLAAVRAYSQSAYEFLLTRAQNRRGAFLYEPGKAA